MSDPDIMSAGLRDGVGVSAPPSIIGVLREEEERAWVNGVGVKDWSFRSSALSGLLNDVDSEK